jgi:hypothetical protein
MRLPDRTRSALSRAGSSFGAPWARSNQAADPVLGCLQIGKGGVASSIPPAKACFHEPWPRSDIVVIRQANQHCKKPRLLDNSIGPHGLKNPIDVNRREAERIAELGLGDRPDAVVQNPQGQALEIGNVAGDVKALDLALALSRDLVAAHDHAGAGGAVARAGCPGSL